MLGVKVKRLRDLVLKATGPSTPATSVHSDLRAQAIAAQGRREWQTAHDLWLRTVTAEPGFVGGWIQLGNMKNELREYSQAVEAFEEAERLEPTSYHAIAGRAGVYERAGKWTEAQRAWLQAASRSEHEAEQSHAYAKALLSAHHGGEGEAVARILLLAVAAVPGFLRSDSQLPLRAKLLLASQPEAARVLLRRQLLANPADRAARFDLASSCLDGGPYKEGLEALRPVIDSDSADTSFLWLAADLHERLGHWTEVLGLCDLATESGAIELRFAERGFNAAVKLGNMIAARKYARMHSRASEGELLFIDRLRGAYEDALEYDRARLLCRWLAHRWPHSGWHRSRSVVLTARTQGLLAADGLVRRLIALHGASPELNRAYCEAAFVAGEPGEAQRRLDWYLAATVGDEDADVLFGYVLANSQGIEAAEEHFLRLAARTYQSRSALVGLAHMASRRRDMRATRELWAKVSALYPDDTIARVEHARATFNAGQHELARALCERQLRAEPSDVTMGEFYVWLLVAVGDPKAVQAYLPTLAEFAGPSWAALEASIHAAGQLGTLDRDWDMIVRLLPSGSTGAASSRAYHCCRLILYYERPDLAGQLLNRSNIDGRHAAWLAPYAASGRLTIRRDLQLPAEARWAQASREVTDGPAQRLRAMSDAEIAAALAQPANTFPTIHVVNKFEQPRGGSELHALDLAARLARHATVELWAPETPHPEFSRNHGVQGVDSSQGRTPAGGVVVFVGIYFPISWVAQARPDRVIFLYNTFEAPMLYERISEAAQLSGISVELLFCSDLIGDECKLPGLFEPSPIDIVEFSPAAQRLPGPFTLGRHSRDVIEKHHPEDGIIYRDVERLGGRSLVLGGTSMRSVFPPSTSLQLLPARSVGIAAFLKGLDVYLYRTSTWVEPWGRVVVEAMACGVPVMVHDVGGYAQIVKHEQNGLLFHTTREALDCLRRLHADPGFRATLGEAGRRTVHDLLSTPAMSRLTMFYLLDA